MRYVKLLSNVLSVLSRNITSAPFIMRLFAYLTTKQNDHTNCHSLFSLISFIIMNVFVIPLCAEFFPTLHYSPQHKKYITLCGLISTIYSLIFRTFNKCTYFSLRLESPSGSRPSVWGPTISLRQTKTYRSPLDSN